MAGEIETLPLVAPTHFVAHDANGHAGRHLAADRPVRICASGARRVDAHGRERIAQTTIMEELPLIRSVVGGGRIFGCAFPQAFRLDPGASTYIPGLREVLERHAEIRVFDNELKPAHVQPTQGNFNLAPATAAIARANQQGAKWRLHVLVYPTHDMPWINEETLTSVTYTDIIDAHLAALANVPGIQSAYNIDVTNELFDGTNTLPGGYRPNRWYTACAPGSVASSAPVPDIFDGPDWVAYLFMKAKETFPDVPLFLCHDQCEQVTSAYHVAHNANVLNFLSKGLEAGLPIDGLNLQGHLALSRGFNAPRLRAFLRDVKSLGLKLMIGELDCRSGDGSTAGQTPYEYDRRCAVLLRRFLDVALEFLEPGDPILTWGMSDIRHPWEAGEKPLPLDVFYQPKPQYAAIRDALKEAN
jgi:endo-1,4-beta-xylanase